MLKLFKYLKPYWWQVLLLIIFTGGQVFANLQLPAQMADIINGGITAENTGYIWQVGVRMILFVLMGAGCSLLSSFLSAKIGAYYARDLRADIFSKVLSLNSEDLEDFSTASLINRTTNDVNQVQQTVMIMLSLMLIAPISCVISLIMAIQTAPDMSWIIAVGAAAIATIITIIMVLVIPKFKIFQKMVDKITLLTRENLTGLKVIRAFNNEALEKKKFEETNTELTKLIMFVEKIMKITNPMINVIFNGLTLLCTYIGISLLTKNFDYLGDMSAFTQYVTQLMVSFLMLSMLFVMLPRANVSAERINDVLNTKSKIIWKSKTEGIPAKIASVEFKKVDFSYPGAKEKVLDDISFSAKAGETVAFIGSTGSGKSTLINLVPRFYEPTSGEILINGSSIKQEPVICKKQMAYVPDNPELYENMRAMDFVNFICDMYEVPLNVREKNIKKYARMFDLTRKMNDEISSFSHGMKQKVALIAALVHEPRFLVMDEPFVGLDPKAVADVKEVMRELVKNGGIVFFSTHILEVAEKLCTKVAIIQNGKLMRVGGMKDVRGDKSLEKVFLELVEK